MLVGFDSSLYGDRTTGATEYQRQLMQMLPLVEPSLELLVYAARGTEQTPSERRMIQEMPWAAGDRVRRILCGGVAWRRRWRADQLDLLHVPFYYLPPGAPRRSVVTIYDCRFLRYPETYPRARAAFLRAAVPWSLRRASHIITISEFTKRELVELLGLPPERISVTLLAQRESFQPITDPSAQAVVRKRYRLPPRFILSTSTLEPRKNLVRLVEAFAMLRREGCPQELVLSGARYFGTNPLEDAIRRLGLGGVVHFPGYIPDADMPGLYSMADAFAYPSLYEGFGIPPLEAMACGTPVVAAGTTSIPEVIGSAACAVDPLSSESIAAGLRRILESVAYASALREAGFARVGMFSWEATARQTVAVYKRVLEEVR
jgi:glycosyltransferase involved in cell wall biosynthesis